MNNDIPDLDISIYMQGHLLADALFEFGSPELIASYNIEFDADAHREAGKKAHGFLGVLTVATEGLSALNQLKSHRENIKRQIQSEILNLIKKGELTPYGFKEPRDIADKPVKIPADLFFSGELNWENSELKYKTLEFSGIRLFRDIFPIIDLKPQIQNKEILPLKNNSKNHKSKNIADLDPDLHIDEKRAADYLGISFRTLQGYRNKGGGPEFIKIGKKAVRYKIQDLINWANIRKKKNTSQY